MFARDRRLGKEWRGILREATGAGGATVAIHIRKWVTFREEILSDGGRDLERPLRRVAVAAVCSNPYAGRWSDDLAELIDFGEYLGDELTRRCQEALGDPVEAYGKGGIVGEH